MFNTDPKSNPLQTQPKPAPVPLATVAHSPARTAPSPFEKSATAPSGTSVIGTDLTILGDRITIISANGISLRLKVEDIRQSSRSTMGTRLINVKEGDKVASVARLAAKDLAGVVVDETPKNGKAKAEAVAETIVIEAGENGSGLEE